MATIRASVEKASTAAVQVRYESPFVRRVAPVGIAQFVGVPLALTVALATLSAWPWLHFVAPLTLSLRLAATVLVAWTLVIALYLKWAGATSLAIDVELRKQHYLQGCAQLTVLVYWGLYWPPVRDVAPLILAQLLFAAAFDLLISGSRRRRYTLGFSAVPVVFSTNLFLWFKADWFVYQFAMIALGLLAKEFIRWRKEGRTAHIFNPSSFPLAVASVILLATGTTAMTWGPEIADTQFRPPHVYLALFLIGIPGQVLFGVTSMTMAAAATTYAFGLVYFWITGTYFFIDSYIPIAVFLGMLLLFTDPSTSPRTELGRIIFGVGYGLGTVICYAALQRAGLPTFYDKLLPVPILNLTIKAIDAAARSPFLARFDPSRFGRRLAPRIRNLAYVGMWTLVFSVMSAAKGVGDNHPGHSLLFWQSACDANRYKACDTLALMERTYCGESGWACNELGLLEYQHRIAERESPRVLFARACQLGYRMGCANVHLVSADTGSPRSASPLFADYSVVLQTGKGPLNERTPLELYERACAEHWMTGCESAGFAYLRGQGVLRTPDRALARFEQACSGGLATACSNAGLMYERGDGIQPDHTRARALLTRACDLGFGDACRNLAEQRRTSN